MPIDEMPCDSGVARGRAEDEAALAAERRVSNSNAAANAPNRNRDGVFMRG